MDRFSNLHTIRPASMGISSALQREIASMKRLGSPSLNLASMGIGSALQEQIASMKRLGSPSLNLASMGIGSALQEQIAFSLGSDRKRR